jgi:UDP-glucose 4-epimerase
VLGTVNVLNAAHRANATHFVFTSSIAVYGHPESAEPFSESTPANPIDPYGIAKLACEQHIRAFEHYYGAPAYTIFRPHNVFGPRQNVADPYRNVVGIFMAQALAGRPMTIFGDGEQSRSFSYIDATAAAIAQAPGTPAARNQTINIGGDEAMTVLELARAVSSVMQVPERVEFLPERKEVRHAHCEHALAHAIFPDAHARNAVDILTGLRRMAHHVSARPLPEPTECPSPIELPQKLPPSWGARLRDSL